MGDAICDLVITDGCDVATVCHLGRTIPAALRTALVERDRTCVVPGCDVAHGLEIDHWDVPFAEGGPTRLSNLARLCRHHHYLRTHQGFQLTGGPGKWHWEPPSTPKTGSNRKRHHAPGQVHARIRPGRPPRSPPTPSTHPCSPSRSESKGPATDAGDPARDGGWRQGRTQPAANADMGDEAGEGASTTPRLRFELPPNLSSHVSGDTPLGDRWSVALSIIPGRRRSSAASSDDVEVSSGCTGSGPERRRPAFGGPRRRTVAQPCGHPEGLARPGGGRR